MLEYVDAFLVAFIVSFLLGSVPFGLVVSKVFYQMDLRSQGSGNIGTTNAIRSMGKVGGFSVFLLDFGKGVFSGIIGLWIGQLFLGIHGQTVLIDQLFSHLTLFSFGPAGSSDVFSIGFAQLLLSFSFLGCIWGHIFSPWLKFKGGKGVAVAIGCLFITFGFIGAALELAVFIILVLVTRYVSVGSVAAAALCPFLSLVFFWGNPVAIILCSIGALTIIWAHRENIKRLIAGTESRIGDKKAKSQTK